MSQELTAKLASATAIREGDRWLFIVEPRSAGMTMNMPAGHVELGETPEEAAQREVREETGLEVRITGLVGIIQSTWKQNHTIRFVFLGEKIGGSESPEKGTVLHWMTLEEAKQGFPGIPKMRALDVVIGWLGEGPLSVANGVRLLDYRAGEPALTV